MPANQPYDTRKYECCAPYYGDIGEEFTRRFRPEFEGALHGYVDQYASLFEHVVLQNDPGSAINPAPPGAPGHAIRQAFATRQKKSFGLIRRHVEDPTIRDEIDANAMGDGPAAWQIVIGFGQVPQTFLNLAEQDKEWNNTRLTEVGFTERTIEHFRALLQRINRERPAAEQKSNVQVWQKLLEEIAGCGNSELKTLVRNEMQRQTMVHPAGHPLAGEPNIAANVMYFAERWRSLIADGSIKHMPPRKRAAPTGNRVDAMLTQTTQRDENGSTQILLGQAKGGGTGPTAAENELGRCCWNCKGFGHMKTDAVGKIICPSPVKPRSFADCIAALESARRRELNRPSRRRFIARKRVSGRMAGINGDIEVVEIDENDNVYDSNGMLIGTVEDTIEEHVEIEHDQQPLHETETETQTAKAGMIVAAAHDAIPPESESAVSIDEDFEDMFTSSTVPIRVAHVDETAYENSMDAPRRRSRKFTLIAAGVAIGAAAMATSQRQSSRLLMVMSLFCCAASTGAIGASPRSVVTIGEKNKCTALAANAKHDIPSEQLNPRTGMAIDTGASMHASGRRELFPPDMISIRKPRITVEIANDETCPVEFQGSMKVPVAYRSSMGSSTMRTGNLLLPNAIYVPALGHNTLVSPKALFHDMSARTYFNDDLFIRLQDGKIVDFKETKALYILPFATPNSESTNKRMLVSKVIPTADELHSRCMHFSLDRIRRSAHCLEHAHIDNLLRTPPAHHPCSSCTRSAARKHDAPKRRGTVFTQFGDCIVSDTCDMEEYSTPFNFRYFISFMDMATKYIAVYFLRTHTHAEVRAAYMQFMADVQDLLPRGRVKVWFMDNGTEFNVSAGVGKDKPGFFANDTDAWLAEYFTRRRFIVPWNPQSNPAESVNRILLRPTRAAISAAGMSTRYWPFGIHQAAIVHNALITDSTTAIHALNASVIDRFHTIVDRQVALPKSPYMMVHRRKFNLDLLHTLFCICYCTLRNPSDIASLPKAAPRTTKAIHLGLDHRRAGYFVYLIEFKRFTTSAFKDTYFECENDFSHADAPHSMTGEIRQPTAAHNLPSTTEQELQRAIPEASEIQVEATPEDRNDRILPDLPSSRTRSRIQRQHAMIMHAKDAIPLGYTCVASEGERALLVKSDIWRPLVCPDNVEAALEQDYEGWMAAYKKDFEAKVANGAFEFVKRKKGMIVHKMGWAHKLIWNDDNTLQEKRARLVGRGYTQIHGRDFSSSYSATPKATAVRLFEAAICQMDLEEEHCDVVKAFTQNKMDTELFVEQPKPLPAALDDEGKPYLIRVVMSLEGFKQSGHLHQVNHSKTFTDENPVATFTCTESEPTLMIHRDGNEILIMALIWTDDVHFAYSRAAAERYERFLSDVYGKRWNFKRKGPVQKFVGINIRRDREGKTVKLSIPQYIEGVYKRFVPSGHIPRSTPYKSGDSVREISVSKDSVERSRMSEKPYLAAVASCIWVYTTLRADIAYILTVLCSVMHDPGEAAWEALLNLIAYLYATMEISICYSADSGTWNIPTEFDSATRERVIRQFGLHAWCDSSWRIPTVTGFIIIILGAPLDWATKLLKVTCHSSAEAEVSAGCACTKALMYVRLLCCAIGLKIDAPVMLLMDSEAAIAIGNNMGVTARTAHFQRWQHYMRWAKLHCYIDFQFVSGKRQKADAITKPVDTTLIREFRRALYGA